MRLFLRLNDIRLVMTFLCALLCHEDYMLMSHVRASIKVYSHAIPIELNDYDYTRDRFYPSNDP